MIASRFSPGSFLVAFCCTYAVVFALDRPLFRYYPLRGDVAWGTAELADAGPAMAWYGLVAAAALAGLGAALLVPERAADRLLRNYFWVFPCATIVVSVYLLRHLFA